MGAAEGCTTEKRAFNVKLARKLMEEAGDAAVEQSEKGSKAGKQKTPAQIKASKAQQKKIFERALEFFRVDWLRYLCAKRGGRPAAHR